MPILTYLKLGGGLVLALALAFGVYWVKGRIDRAADADRVEAQAAADVSHAKAALEIATAQIAADRASIAEAETARAKADETIRQREADNAALLEALRQRAKTLAPVNAACVYGPGTQRLLLDAQRGLATTGAAALPDAPGSAH